MNPGDLYKGIALRLSMAAPALGVDAAYVEGFLARNHRAMKTVLLESWPVLPVPERADYRFCRSCGHVAHHTEVRTHAAIMGIPCSGPFYPMPAPGKEWAADHNFAGIRSRMTARWGLCGVCGEIQRVMAQRGVLFSHDRPIDVEIDGPRKRTRPECAGGHTAPVVASRLHPDAGVSSGTGGIFAAPDVSGDLSGIEWRPERKARDPWRLK